MTSFQAADDPLQRTVSYWNKRTHMKDSDFHIIGIGTSAGGLEALKELFDFIPLNFAHAIVIVQHLSPDYKSLMAELLAKHTNLPVYEVVNDLEVKGRSVYLIPPKKNMTIEYNVFKLTDKNKYQETRQPIDIFFESLAKSEGKRSIGVILSGTGSDGSRGIMSIKQAGGITIAQSPNQAAFDGMPTNAIKTGMVEHVLHLQDLVPALLTIIKEHSEHSQLSNHIISDRQNFSRILDLLKSNHQLNFAEYKHHTLVRRIERRMLSLNINDLESYLQLVENDEEESFRLHREFLIRVKKVFRDS